MTFRGQETHHWGAACAALLFVLIGWTAVGLAQSHLQHRSGKGVVPIYDGYELNPDGTLTLWFGYLNRNSEEELDVPVGPENAFDGPQPDRGQPTHFRPRRHKTIFSVTVPESEARSVRWNVTANGRTLSAVATILPSSLITRKKGTLNSLAGTEPNVPPVVQVKVAKPATASGGAVLQVDATDDGQPERSMLGGPMKPSLSVSWVKYRGPGGVTFDPVTQRLPGKGTATTKATFTTAGDYQLLVTVDDGSQSFGEYCCWTNKLLTISVPEAAQGK